MEFTDGAELTTPVEKAATDLMRVVTAPVEKAVRALEKVVTDGRRGGDGGGPWWAGGAMEMEEGGRLRSGAVEMPAAGHSDVMQNTEAVRRNVVMALRNGSV
jgi:hypothetical protein